MVIKFDVTVYNQALTPSQKSPYYTTFSMLLRFLSRCLAFILFILNLFIQTLLNIQIVSINIPYLPHTVGRQFLTKSLQIKEHEAWLFHNNLF